jgi:hypothetical protein
MITASQAERTPRYRGVSYTGPINEAKRLVTVLELAEKLSGASGVRRGREIAFVCPLHDDHDPSLRVDPERGVWFCDPCLRGGDVVELARLAWKYDERDAHVAAAMLLVEFDREVPQRPPSWHDRQSRQARARRAIESAKARRVQRRIYRWILAPPLANIEDEDERREEIGHAWEDAGKIARLLIAHPEALR